MSGAGWRDEARRKLVGRPGMRIALRELVPTTELPPWPCVLPWTRLEISTRGFHGPCCPDYQVMPDRAAIDLPALWNGPNMRAFRRGMTNADHLAKCRRSCPVLAGGTAQPADFALVGGTAAFLDRQIAAADEMLEGREVLAAGPLDLLFAPTTYCNYDCLMCEWGEEGTLDDELPASFYEHLPLSTLRTIEVAGGEPLASPAFRDFLASLDFAVHPQLSLALVTNGSYLTPREQERLERVPFASMTVSLNAASEETYLAVNRGLPFARVRTNLDALLERRRDGRFRGGLAYSMVLLRRNLDEIRAFAELARRDGVGVRFMLPMFDRNGQSFLTDRALMEGTLRELDAVAREEDGLGRADCARAIRGEAQVLRDRLRAGVLVVLPDGRRAPRDAALE